MTESARSFAINAHGDQLYGINPYTVHLHDVVSRVAQANDTVLNPEYLQNVAWLHDVLEDTSVTFNELQSAFGYWVAGSVSIITDPSFLPSRKERKAHANRAFKLLDPERITHRAALIVKTADRLANIRYSKAVENKGKLKMYRKEHPEFEAATRREGLVPAYWDRMQIDLGLINPSNS